MDSRRMEAAARYLVALLNSEPYRSDWLRYAIRPRPGTINKAAVAQVLAQHLWDAGIVSENQRTLPRDLKDRIGRALRGEVLMPDTLKYFIDAFGFDEDEATELWERYGRAISETDDPGPGHRTISLHEFHYLGPTGLPAHHRTVHVIKALVDGLTSYPYTFDTHEAEVSVERGGVAGPLYQREDGLFAVDIVFHEPLQAGETRSFEYHTDFHYSDAPAPVFRRQARRLVENLELRVQFDRKKQPTRVWWASWKSLDGPATKQELMALDADGAVQQYVTSMRNQIAGFVWAW